MPDSLPASVDVAVVGAGPVGLTLAARLGAAGVRVAVVEREAAPPGLPRAAHLGREALAVLDGAGVGDAVRRHGRPITGFDLVDRRGRVLLQAESAGADGRLVHQPTVETLLRERLAALGVPLLHGHAVETAGDAGIAGAGPDGPFRLVARWTVGCDGAGSPVRRAMGAPLVPSVRGGFAQTWLVVDVELLRPVALPERLQQTADPRAPATYVPFPGARRRWEFRLGDDETEAKALASVARRLSHVVDGTAVRVERAAVYTFRALVADGWRRGRVLLAGDAAHVMPPFLGQGLGVGLLDADWLARALPAALAGDARALDAYEARRRPHVEATTRVAVQIGRLVTLPPPTAAVRDVALRAAGRVLGRPVRVVRRLPEA